MTRHDQLRAECQRFHNAHPEVWDAFVALTMQAIRKGHKNYGARAIWSVLRWQSDMGEDGMSNFKLNDHHTPFYARRFHAVYPEHDGFFRLREQKSESAPPSTLPPLSPSDFPYL